MIDGRVLFEEVRRFEAEYPGSDWVPRIRGLGAWLGPGPGPSLIIEAPDSRTGRRRPRSHENARREFVRDLMGGEPRAIEAAALIDKYDSSYVVGLVGEYGGKDD